jgi:tetratricopeptide (TPR) repeat protein
LRDRARIDATRRSAAPAERAEALLQQGLALMKLGRLDNALAKYDEALAVRPDYAAALNNRGNVLLDLNRFAEALVSYERALALQPGFAEALNNRGIALLHLKRPGEALASFEAALAAGSTHPEVFNNRGNALRNLARPADALASYDQALAMQPNYVGALYNRGNVLRDLQRPDEALLSYEQALALRPDYPEALSSRGIAFLDLKRPAEALASYDKALALRPDYAQALFNRSLVSLLTGDFAAGWAGYEYRWESEGATPRRLTAPCPEWRGEDLRGKRIGVYEEQGLGDIIQFARYLPLLSAMGASVTLFVRPSLHRLLNPLTPLIRITDRPQKGDAFDYQSALMSLPGAFGTTLDSVPAQIPYLFAEPALVERWRQRLGGHGFKIGIAWQGNPSGKINAGRSLPLRCFRAIAAIPGVRLISLQKTHGLDQLADLPPGMTVETLGDDFDSGKDAFIDTAAVIANLDLVISCDSAIVQVAAAMGRPVWVALKLVPHWPWLLDRDDSPWCPTARLFRQRQRGDWDEVFERIAAAVAPVAAQPPSTANEVAAKLEAGLAQHRAGKFDEAAALYSQILAVEPRHFDALHLLGIVRSQQGRQEEALDSITAALALRPQSAEALAHRGAALAKLGRHEDALRSYDEALALRPDFPEALNNRGIALFVLKRLSEALASYERALAIRPDYVDALVHRGNVLRYLERPEEALASYDKALALQPDYPEALIDRGNVLQDLKRIEEALASYDRALALRPGSADAHHNRAIAALLIGDFAAGWAGYEHRWRRHSARPRKLVAPYPEWRGEDLSNRRIIVYEEQGIGDVIQFVRFLPLLSAMGGAVTLLVRASLHRLLRPLVPAVHLVDRPPDDAAFDYQCALMSLPAVLGTRLDSLPAEVPYLFADEGLAATWRQRLGSNGFKIGICWQGNPAARVDIGRSPPLLAFRPLAAIPGVRLISLQKTHGLDQLRGLPADMTVETLGDDFDSGPDAFVDTAAVIANLDLVISCDTAIVQVAAAMARPVWVALKHVPHWAWMLDRADSPWYPTVRLFRQARPGDWDEVFGRIAAEVAHRQGGALHNRGRHEEALASYDQAVTLRSDFPEALNNRGVTLFELKRPAEALASYDKALALRPDYAAALYNRGNALLHFERPAEALEAYDKALTLRPDHAATLNNRGKVLLDLNRPAEALASLDRALTLEPDYAAALNNRGSALRDLGRPAEALASYDQALALHPDFIEGLSNRATALQLLRRSDEALASYDKVLALQPEYSHALFNRAMTLLSAGDFAAGWPGYEYRWERDGASRRRLVTAYPAWRGEDLRGRRIVVYEEQGLGDIIHFARYLPLLAAMGASVTFLVRASLHRLLRPLAAAVHLTDREPHGENFDFQSALLSLPGGCGTTLGTIPAEVSYLGAEEALAAQWRQRLGSDGFKIGICWQGNPSVKADIGRSPPLRSFWPIAAIPGVRLISLQKTHGLDQLAALPEGMTVETLGDDFDSGPDAFVDSAAVIANLDLVVTGDTSLAHLAGAIGRPVWLALKHVPDWRWMFDRDDSPWYPTVRLFRQTRAGDWDGVFARVAAELAPIAPARSARQLAAVAFERGDILLDRGRIEEALASYDEALAIQPDNAEALSNRGLGLRALGRLEDALASFDRALACRPANPDALSNRGVALHELGRFDKALQSYDEALALRPDFADCRFNRALLLLLLGRFGEGWAEFEWRKSRTARQFAAPEWRGEDPRGKRVLVHAEPALGEVLQFVRFLGRVAARGAEVLLEVPPALVELLRPLDGVSRVIARGNELPEVDYHLSLLSLPFVLGLGESEFAAGVPYLQAERRRIDAWSKRLPGGEFRIGICWQGNPQADFDRRRSIPLRAFAPLSQVPGMRLISLQKHHGVAQLAELADTMRLADLGSDFDAGPSAFLDTAAVMMQLDLVISADTAIAQLAGALGRPLWVVLPDVPDWRWMLEREDSPWCPSARLFRQRRRGDWDEVFARLGRELAAVVAGERDRLLPPAREAL